MVQNFFSNIWLKIDEFLKSLNLDNHIDKLIDTYFTPLHELFKWLLVILLLIIVVLGVITLIKKMFKFTLFLTIIVIIVVFLSKK